MLFNRRKFKYRGGRQVSESRAVTIAFVIGIILVALLIYFF